MECKNVHGRMKLVRNESPLMKFESSMWDGQYMAPVSNFKEDF
jgi:hypothetical protein